MVVMGQPPASQQPPYAMVIEKLTKEVETLKAKEEAVKFL